jgi:S-adenosylmethionine synthetase
VQKI